MKIIKILLGILVVLLILFVIALFVVGSHLGQIVKAGMEAAGPKVTQTTLTVDAVDVSLLGGSAGVKKFALGNPDGYKSPQAISFDKAAVSIVPGSVLSDKIVIHSVEIRSPQITFDGNPLGANNLKQIMANVNAFTGSSANTSAAADTNSPTAAPANATPAEKKAAKKLQVDDFLITGAKVHANLTGLVTKEIDIPIPDIHFTALGTGPDGITAADLTKKVLDQITAETIQSLVAAVKDLAKDLANTAKGAAQDAVNKALNDATQNTGAAGTNAVNQLKKGLNGLLGK